MVFEFNEASLIKFSKDIYIYIYNNMNNVDNNKNKIYYISQKFLQF